VILPIYIFHEDDDLLIVDKPAGLLSVPGRELPDSLQTRLAKTHPESLLVHRLDMATSGVMVFAKHKAAQRHLGLQFERRHTRKTYIAEVSGVVEGDSGRINLPLIADWPNRPRQMVSWEHGKPSLTDWEVIDRAKKTPILGDRIYAADEVFNAAARLRLHAAQLTLHHPTGGDLITFESPCPF